jgi:TolB-like protein
LPFANVSGDAEQEYFVDGVTESLTTDLSRIRGALVIGRNTAWVQSASGGVAKHLSANSLLHRRLPASQLLYT